GRRAQDGRHQRRLMAPAWRRGLLAAGRLTPLGDVPSAMAKITVNKCPYCEGTSFARFTDLNFAPVLVTKGQDVAANFVLSAFWKSALRDSHYFALILCKSCGHSAFFAQDPRKLLEGIGGTLPLAIEVKEEPPKEPYR